MIIPHRIYAHNTDLKVKEFNILIFQRREMIDLDNKKSSSCLKVAFNNVPLVVYCGKSGTTSQTLEGSISEIKSPKLKDQHKNRHVTILFCVKKSIALALNI